MVRPAKPKAAAKTAKSAKTVKPTKAKATADSLINADEKALFLHHLPIIEAAKIRVENVKGELKKLLISAKADGFSTADFTYAIEVQTPEREQVSKETIARRLTIAGFMGSDLGLQLDLFQGVPASDRAGTINSGFTPFTTDEMEHQQDLADEASKH